MWNIAAFAQAAMPQDRAEKIADAIYKAESSKKYPYGIVSIKIKGNTQAEKEAYARKICINTIKNNWRRYQKSAKTNDFVEFLGNRYAPVGADNDKSNLNKNWIANVRYFLNKSS